MGSWLSIEKASCQPSHIDTHSPVICGEVFQGERGIMLHDRNGQSVVEYIVVLAIFIALVGGALWEVFSTLRDKFNDVNTEIGS
jgi:Flp pilus assembly pilin Flp